MLAAFFKKKDKWAGGEYFSFIYIYIYIYMKEKYYIYLT